MGPVDLMVVSGEVMIERFDPVPEGDRGDQDYLSSNQFWDNVEMADATDDVPKRRMGSGGVYEHHTYVRLQGVLSDNTTATLDVENVEPTMFIELPAEEIGADPNGPRGVSGGGLSGTPWTRDDMEAVCDSIVAATGKKRMSLRPTPIATHRGFHYDPDLDDVTKRRDRLMMAVQADAASEIKAVNNALWGLVKVPVRLRDRIGGHWSTLPPVSVLRSTKLLKRLGSGPLRKLLPTGYLTACGELPKSTTAKLRREPKLPAWWDAEVAKIAPPDPRGWYLGHSFMPCEGNVNAFQQLMTRVDFTPSSYVRVEKYRIIRDSDTLSQFHAACEVNDLAPGDPDMPFALQRMLSVDFEVQSANLRSMPEPQNIGDMMVVISCSFSNVFKKPDSSPVPAGEIDRRVSLVAGTRANPNHPSLKGVEVRHYATEGEMMDAFRDLVMVEEEVDIITGWNVRDFDLKYFFERADHPGVHCTRAKRFSRTLQQESQKKVKKLNRGGYGDIHTYHRFGPIVVDALPWVKEIKKLSSYKLDAVAEHYLKDNKRDMPYEEMFKIIADGTPDQMAEVVAYCQQDADLVTRIADKTKMIPLLFEQCKVFRTPLQQRVDSGQGVRVVNQLIYTAHKNGFVMNNMEKQGYGEAAGVRPDRGGNKDKNQAVQYEGATVIEPIKGYYDTPIATLDFASLYPSIMLAHNLCYSTTLDHLPDWVLDRLNKELADDRPPYSKEVAPGVKHHWAQHVTGILTTLLNAILGQRKVAKFDMALFAAMETDASDLNVNATREIRARAVKMMAKEGTPMWRAGRARMDLVESVDGGAVEELTEAWETLRLVMVAEAEAQLAAGGKGAKFGKVRLENLERLRIGGSDAAESIANENKEKKEVQNGRQLALKVSANSVYGFTGATVGQIVFKPLAATVTATGRMMIFDCLETANRTVYTADGYRIGFQTIYGDTDSIMIRILVLEAPDGTRNPKVGADTEVKLLTIGANRLADYLTNEHFESSYVVMEMEQVQAGFLLCKKKRYVALVDGEMYYKGIDVVRRDTFQIVNRTSKSVVRALMIDKDSEKADGIICDVLSSMLSRQLPLSDFVYTKARAASYSQSNDTPSHMAVVYAAKRNNPGSEDPVGSRVKYVIGCKEDYVRIRDPDWDEDVEYEEEEDPLPVKRRMGRASGWRERTQGSIAGSMKADVMIAELKKEKKKRSIAKKKASADEIIASKARSPEELTKETTNSIDMVYYLEKLSRPMKEITQFHIKERVDSIFASAMQIARSSKGSARALSKDAIMCRLRKTSRRLP